MKHAFVIMAISATLFTSCMKSDYTNTIEEEPILQNEVYDAWTLIDKSYLDTRTQGPTTTVNASFGQTKASFGMNVTGSHASIVFSPGDSFVMLDEEDNVATYTTSEGGVNASFTSSESVSGSKFYCVFPDYQKRGTYGGLNVFGINIPTEQDAVAGNIKDGYYRGYAEIDNLDSDIYFYNALAVLRFKMTGPAVSSVSEVTLRGETFIAGDSAMMIENGRPLVTYDVSYLDAVRSKSITLKGPFVAGKEYYIVLAPGEQSVISMTFSDGNGNSKSKVSTNEILFSSTSITDIGTIDLGENLTSPDPEAPIKYMEATSGLVPVTLAIVPDGFTREQLADYELLAMSAIDYLFTVEPFHSYRKYFTVWILKVASEESGANVTDGNGNITTARNCYFGSKWGEDNYSDMDLNSDILYDYIQNNCPDIVDGSHTTSQVPIAVIINDERSGGICHLYSSGGGYAMVPYSYSGFPLGWSYPLQSAIDDEDPSAGIQDTPESVFDEVGSFIGDWRNTFIHEFGGHCFARLTDEYWYTEDKGAASEIESHRWFVPYGLNISPSYSNPPWQTDLLDRRDELIAINPLYSRIGVFQGGGVSILNRWRSERVSCMIDNRRYFSTWQRVLAVSRIMSLASGPLTWESFIALDKPEDPVRDGPVNTQNNALSRIPPRPMPLLPPPVLVE